MKYNVVDALITLTKNKSLTIVCLQWNLFVNWCLKQVADVNMLRAETHKFESHYIDRLGGKSTINHLSTYTFFDLFV